MPQVFEKFKTYLSAKSLSQTAKILNERGYRMKGWTTHGHKPRGGKKFNKMAVCRLLRNPLYVGWIVHKGVECKGEHEALVPEELFNEAGVLMDLNWKGTLHKDGYEIKHNFVLRGLLRFKHEPVFLMRPRRAEILLLQMPLGNKWDKTACEGRSVPAKTLEEHVLRRLGVLGENVKLLDDVVKSARWLSSQELPIPSYGTNQTISVRMPPFIHSRLLMIQQDEGKGFYLIDTFPLPPEMCRPKRAAYKRKPRPPKPAPPPPPNIQDFLRKAFAFKKRLRENPALTREALAQEENINLVQLEKILSLLTLTPAAQQAILAMPKERLPSIEKQVWEQLRNSEGMQ